MFGNTISCEERVENRFRYQIGAKTLSDAEVKKIGDALDETTNSSFAKKNLGEVLKQQRLTFCCCNIRW
jgi:hypothetical protein